MTAHTHAHQHGSALVLAVLVAGIVAGLGVSIAHAFMVDATRVENRLLDLQARQYLLAAEELAQLALSQDATMTAGDHLLEDWAQPLPPLATDEGQVWVQLEDAQGRFNLNNLALRREGLEELGLPIAQRFTLAQRLFIRLLQSFPDLPLSEAEAVALTEALIDWLDEDDRPLGFGGAESLYYVNETPAYRPANRLLLNVSELRLVRHMQPALYQRLLPLVVALPETTPLNLNTALPALLSALEPEEASANKGLAGQLRGRQLSDPFTTHEDAALEPALEPLFAEQGSAAAYAVGSNYFLLHARVYHAGAERRLHSVLRRDETGTHVLGRRFGSPLDLPVGGGVNEGVQMTIPESR